MSIVMYDSIDPSQIPDNAQAAAGYVNGSWPTWSSLAAKFPNAHRLSIAVNSSGDATCLDVENGDATVGDAPGWYARQVAVGVWRPCFYASAGIMDGLVATLQQAGIARSSVRLWSAHYSGEHICAPGSCGTTSTAMDATQWTDQALGRNLDQSLLVDDFFGTPGPVIATWVAAGEGSLAGMCGGIFRNAVSTVLRLTAERSPHAAYNVAMANYLDAVFAQDRAEVPAGVIVRHPDGGTVAAFSSRGDQTLQGLANAWKCAPSTVVRVTAESSPGAVFESGFADYLDGVFTRSVVHVPAGVSLFYEK